MFIVNGIDFCFGCGRIGWVFIACVGGGVEIGVVTGSSEYVVCFVSAVDLDLGVGLDSVVDLDGVLDPFGDLTRSVLVAESLLGILAFMIDAFSVFDGSLKVVVSVIVEVAGDVKDVGGTVSINGLVP